MTRLVRCAQIDPGLDWSASGQGGETRAPHPPALALFSLLDSQVDSFAQTTQLHSLAIAMADVDYKAVKTHPISKRNDGSTGHKPHSNEEEYKKLYERSIKDPLGFWDEVSSSTVP